MLIRCGANSMASARIKPLEPRLAGRDMTAVRRANMRRNAGKCDDGPRRRDLIRCGTAARVRMNAPSRATDKISRHSARLMSRKAVWRRRPGIADEDIEIRRTGLVAADDHLFNCVRLRHVGEAGNRHCLAVLRLDFRNDRHPDAASSRRPLTTTQAPSAARKWAMLRPILRPAPVTRATFPSRGRCIRDSLPCKPSLHLYHKAASFSFNGLP